jgi:L-fuconolactonase
VPDATDDDVVGEEILEPDLAICDPHHHLWEAHDTFGGRYMTDELRDDASSGHHIEKTVYVQCRSGYRTSGPEQFRCVGEPEFVVAADPSGFIAGIVGFADLCTPDLDDVLAALAEAAAGRLRGIRQSTAHDESLEIPMRMAPAGLIHDSAFRRGFGALARAGLSFDAWVFHPQIPELTRLAREYPDVTIVLDHLGGRIGVGPYRQRQAEVLATWRASMTDLAFCPNVTVKLGGTGLPLFENDWHEREAGATAKEIAAAYGDDVGFCIETFGVDRCMFESDFPVDKQSYSYAALWNAFKLMVAGASDSEKRALFHDTATRVYRI